MPWFTARVADNIDLGGGFTWLKLGGCGPLGDARPGQFAMLRGMWDRDPILPRAFSVLDVEGEQAQFLIRRVGRGSGLLGQAAVGDDITVLGPLGNGFPDPVDGCIDLLVAGGCGFPPLYLAARQALAVGKADQIELLLGAKRRDEIVLVHHLADAGASVTTITEDGSAGGRGLVTDLLRNRLEVLGGRDDITCRILACGPPLMLRAVREVSREHDCECLLSLEAGMACGLGACLGCAVERRGGGYLHVCKDGPVFPAEEVWP